MRTSVAGIAGGVVVIVSLSLLFAVNVASRHAPAAVPARVTGPDDACRYDTDCRCASFDGAEFIPGEFTQSRCEQGVCAQCLYD